MKYDESKGVCKKENKRNMSIEEYELREKEKKVEGILTGKNKANLLTSKKQAHTF